MTPEAPKVLSLPPWIGSVAEIPGEVAIAQIDPRKLPHLVRQLLRDRVSYYWPRERVETAYAKGSLAWGRSVFPGSVFIDIGSYVDRRNKDLADDFCRFCGWRLTWMRAGTGATRSILRQDLESVEKTILANDGRFFPLVKIVAGRRVRIISGPFVNITGTAIGDGPKHTVQVGVSLLGRGATLEIARELVEPL